MARGIEGRLCEKGEHQRHLVFPLFLSTEAAVGRVCSSESVTASVQSRNAGLWCSCRRLQVTEAEAWGSSSSPSFHLPANCAGLPIVHWADTAPMPVKALVTAPSSEVMLEGFQKREMVPHLFGYPLAASLRVLQLLRVLFTIHQHVTGPSQHRGT